jgi:hypothetical protein
MTVMSAQSELMETTAFDLVVVPLPMQVSG